MFFPMPQRGIEGTFPNSLHGPGTLVFNLMLIVGMGFASTLVGRHFRYYTDPRILAVLGFGIWTGFSIPAMTANEPTPWMGVEERICAYASMLWIAVLSIGLLRG